MKVVRISIVLGVLCLSSAAAQASPVTIDFESYNLGGSQFLDTPETPTFNNIGGSGTTVQILGHDDVRIYDLVQFSGGTYPGPGRQAMIDMNWSNFNNPLGTDITFDHAVSNFSLLAGDFGSDDDSPLRIEAFDAGNVSLGVATSLWPNTAEPPFAHLTLALSGIRRVHYSSGGTFQNSTFVDDITFTPGATDGAPVPEPASLLLLGTGLVAVARRRFTPRR